MLDTFLNSEISLDVAYWQGVLRIEHREQTGRLKSHLAFAEEHSPQDFCRVLWPLRGLSEQILECRTREDSAACKKLAAQENAN